MYSEYYWNLIAAWVRTLQEDKFFVRLDEKTLLHFDVLDTSKMREAPDGEAAHELYGKMRRAMDVIPWGVVLTEVVRRDKDTGEARNVRVTVDATKEFCLCLRHACVDVDWAPDPNAPAHMAPVPSSHLGVWFCGRQTHSEGAYAIGEDRGGYHCPRSPRRDPSRSPLRDRSCSISPPRAVEATWPTRASSSAAVALFELARVRNKRLCAPRGAAVSAVAHAWVDQVTGLRRAVERADGQGVEKAVAIIGQAVARAVDGDAKYERFSQHLEAVQPEEAVAPTRLPAAGFAHSAYGRAPRGMRFLAVMGKKLVSTPPMALRPLACRVRVAASRRKPGPSRTPPGSPPRPLPVSPPPLPTLRYHGHPLRSLGMAPVTLIIAPSAAADGSRWEVGDAAPPGRGWCRGTARGLPGSGGHDPHQHTGLVSPHGTGIAPTLGVGPCGACNPAWLRPAAAGGPARGGGYVGRRALPRGRTTGRHVWQRRPVPIPCRLCLPHWGTCLAFYLVLLVGRRRAPIPIRGIGPMQRFPPF